MNGAHPPAYEVVVSPSPDDWDAQFPGKGDAGHGGQRFHINYDGTETGAGLTKTVQTGFDTPVELLDGQGNWSPIAEFGHTSYFSLGAVLPATTVTPNGSTEGNCNLVADGTGNVIVPAAGDGTHDVDLATAVPVPFKGAGHYDCDYTTGDVTASASPGTADFVLLDYEVRPTALIDEVPMGNGLGLLDVDTPRVKWLHNRWKLEWKVEKAAQGTGDFSGWLMVFRP